MSNYRIAITLDGRDNVSDELRNVNRELDDLGNQPGKVQGLAGGLNALAAAAGPVGAAMAALGVAMEVLDFAGQVNEVAAFGAEITLAADTFERLTGGAAGASATLALLQDATGGIVDDMTLMKGANQLFITGLAETGEQAAELTKIAVTLGQRLGVDAVGSIENLNAALLNNSFERLDTLGISAGKVRERIAELKEEGLDMSQAFAQAVVEQGNAAIDKFGFSLTETATNVNKLEKAFTDMSASVSVAVSGVREQVAGLALDVLGLSDNIDEMQRRISTGAAVVETDLGASIADRLRDSLEFSGVDADLATVYGEKYAEAIGIALEGPMADTLKRISSVGLRNLMTQPGLAAGMGISDADLQAVYGSLMTPLGAQQSGDGQWNFGNAIVSQRDSYRVADEMLAAMSGEIMKTSYDAFMASMPTSFIQQERQNFTNNVTSFERGLQSIRNALDPANLPFMGFRAGMQSAGDAVLSFSAMQMQAAEEMRAADAMRANVPDLLSGAFGANMDFNAAFNDLTGGSFAEVGGIEIFDRANLDELESKAQSLEEAVARMRENPFIDQNTLSMMEIMADRARGVADAASNAADAFERMSLSELFGQQSGGAQGEFNQMVASNIEDPEARAAFMRQAGLMTGELTDASLKFDEEIAPTIAMIASEQGGEVAAEVAAKALEVYQAALLAGFDTSTAASFAQQSVGVEVGTVGGVNPLDFMVNPGEGFNAVMGRTGLSREQLEASGAVRNGYLQPGSFNFGGEEGEGLVPVEQTEEFATFMAEAQLSAEGVQTALSEATVDPLSESVVLATDNINLMENALQTINSTEYKARINVELLFSDPTGRTMGNDVGFQKAVLSALRSNGVQFETGGGGAAPRGSVGPV